MKSNNESDIFLSRKDVKNVIQNQKKDVNKKSQCAVCGQKFRFLKALQKHEARHQGEGGFMCRNCDMHFTTQEAREKHRDKEHKVLSCKICNIRFESDCEYLHHTTNLHEGRDRELCMCSSCGKQFKTKGELTHHVNSKCGTIKKYQCKVCYQTLMTSGSLHNHMLRHSGTRAFMCRFCAKTFLTAGQLTVHERIHTQEKAFVCEICNKGFCHRQSLITHSTLHTGIKPFQCEGCGNSFSCVGNLLKHRKTHAETCGKIPLTTHRVKHPVTKLKVQVNTPPTVKLKTLEKRKKIELAVTDQNQTSKAWQDTNVNSLQGNLVNNDDINDETKNNFNITDENYFIPDVNLSADEEKKDLKYDENLPIESIIFVKNENLIPAINLTKNQVSDSMIEDDCNKQNFPNFLSNDNENKFLLDDINYIPTSVEKLECDYKNTINHLEAKINEENLTELKNTVDSDEDWSNELETISNRNSDSENSDDSIDLNTRKLKLDQKKKEQRKKTRNRKNSIFNRKKIKEFIIERGFNAENGLNCKYCGNHYTVPMWLMKHELKHEKEMKDGKLSLIKCSCCSKIYDTKQECINHQQSEHRNELTCNTCEKVFSNPDSLKAHFNVYHRGQPRKKYAYICDKCGKVYKQKAMLIAHEHNNCGDQPMYPCTVCEKSFSSKHVLKSHMRVHLPEKSLLCKFCGKSFHWKGQLKIHERSHTGEKPFKCQHCPKAFAYRESLITHSTLHTGIKPHLCENCGSRFSCIGNLLKHRRTHASTCGMVTQVKTEVLVTLT